RRGNALFPSPLLAPYNQQTQDQNATLSPLLRLAEQLLPDVRRTEMTRLAFSNIAEHQFQKVNRNQKAVAVNFSGRQMLDNSTVPHLGKEFERRLAHPPAPY